ncbi:MAG: cytochrome C biogenesis protein [Acidobacteria bacterium RIFCSPLOWO2_02_FULL_60_20]|nr:MAG: cytochrome C biogenesis protein [Acidobacteria bacterium RIFCSPLOWO2_02_FULL_60_20]
MGGVSIVAAFSAGLISFLSPCVLPLVPGYISMVSGASVDELKAEDNTRVLRKVLLHSLLFIAGFSIVFISLGASATWLGQVLLSRMSLLYKVAGVIIIIFGLHLTGLLRIGFLYRDKRFHSAGKPATALGAFVIGLAFAFGWTPCIGPILAAILGLAASQQTVSAGITLLAVYSLGLAIPFLLTSLGINRFLRFYDRFRVHLRQVEVFSGVILILLGAMIYTNQFTRLSGYLSFLNRFAL